MGVGSHAEIGGGAVLAVLELLADPALLGERIARLKAAERDANSAMAAVGPAHEVLALRDEAERLKSEANKRLNDASERADQIVRQADKLAEKLVSDAKDEAAATSAAASKLSHEAHEAMAAANAHAAGVDVADAELQQARAKMEKAQQRLNDMVAEVATTREQLLAEKRRLAEVADQLRGAI